MFRLCVCLLTTCYYSGSMLFTHLYITMQIHNARFYARGSLQIHSGRRVVVSWCV